MEYISEVPWRKIKQGKRKRQRWGYKVKQVGEGELYSRNGISAKTGSKLLGSKAIGSGGWRVPVRRNSKCRDPKAGVTVWLVGCGLGQGEGGEGVERSEVVERSLRSVD